MKHLISYICQQEEICQLPLEVIEDIMIQIGDDAYLCESDKSELLYLFIRERWKKGLYLTEKSQNVVDIVRWMQ